MTTVSLENNQSELSVLFEVKKIEIREQELGKSTQHTDSAQSRVNHGSASVLNKMIFWNEKESENLTMKNGPQMLHALIKVKQGEEEDKVHGDLCRREMQVELMLS